MDNYASDLSDETELPLFQSIWFKVDCLKNVSAWALRLMVWALRATGLSRLLSRLCSRPLMWEAEVPYFAQTEISQVTDGITEYTPLTQAVKLQRIGPIHAKRKNGLAVWPQLKKKHGKYVNVQTRH